MESNTYFNSKKSDKIILVVDDNSINRRILCKILGEEFTAIEAENGQNALDILSEGGKSFSAILLDLVMPIMDGYEFLEILKSTPFSDIPVIVTTGNIGQENESRAFDLGAWDFVGKPYNTRILKSRLKNAIARSETAAYEQLKYLAEYDTLTGIFNKQKFFQATSEMFESNIADKFAFVRFDISRFSLINSFYGSEMGDSLLKYIANKIRDFASNNIEMTYGRIEADVFSFCVPHTDEESLLDIVKQSKSDFKKFPLDFDIVSTYGIYIVEDLSIPVYKIADYANLALKSVKGNYINNWGFYTKEMSNDLETEQEIVNEMNDALANEQFVIYLQPKYDLHTELPAGAEALVRWNHPQKGLISPGVFIPIFERNGFISKLDYYVWEKACMLLHKWIENGSRVYPISVNVSRVNLYNPNLVDIFCSITDKYNVPRNLFNLELTESAYADNPDSIRDTIKHLRAKGFVVMMDDFGSGYSSLNILKDVEVDVIKIDMKFLYESEFAGRGENIVASVVRMAKWLNVPTIAEGVEKEEQVEFLSSIGCEYIQGYYFAKPMPINDYENLVANETVFVPKERQNFDTDSLWAINPQMEMLFSNMTQAVGIYEFENDKLEILRVNKAFYDLFGYEDVSSRINNPMNAVKMEFLEAVLNAFRTAISTKGTTECEYQRVCLGNTSKWIRLVLKFINQIGGKSILLGNLFDISAQKELDFELQKYKSALEQHGGYSNKILIVDDIELNRIILKEMFKKRFTVLEAENGNDAIKVLEENNNSVDIILLDLNMPQMNGSDFLEFKKHNSAISDIPVIIITADDSTEQQINTLSLGADDYIVKPFVEEIVLKRVNHVIESHKRFREVLREYNNVVEKSNADSLTGIYNRAAGKAFISNVLDTQPDKNHALIMLDVDKFKEINDGFGHHEGDEVLLTIAKTIKKFFRKSDIVCRFGGDEFCILMTSISSGEVAFKKCSELCNHIKSLHIGKTGISVTISIGIALNNAEYNNFDSMYKKADMALYESKRNGRGIATLYGSNLTVTTTNHWVDKEWLFDTLEDSIAIIDLETYDYLFVSNTGLNALGIESYSGKKCYEVLHARSSPCPNCVVGRLSKDKFYQWKYYNKLLKKNFILKDKLINFENKTAHLQMTVDISKVVLNSPVPEED